MSQDMGSLTKQNQSMHKYYKENRSFILYFPGL